MKLFKKKKEPSCCEGSGDTTGSVTGADVKILGTGCAKCVQLGDHAKEALAILDLPVEIEKVMDVADIAAYGVMSTPAIVYKNTVISYGKVLSVEQIVALLKQQQ